MHNDQPAIRVALIGHGWMGRILGRHLYKAEGMRLVAICDHNLAEQNIATTYAHKDYGTPTCVTNYRDLSEDTFDAVIVATPIDTHFTIGSWALRAGKHLLLEKPGMTTAAQAKDLIALAKKHNVSLSIDYTLLFEQVISIIDDLQNQNLIGQVQSARFQRSQPVNESMMQRSCYDELAPHVFSLLEHFDHRRSDSGSILSTQGNLTDSANTQVTLSSGLTCDMDIEFVRPKNGTVHANIATIRQCTLSVNPAKDAQANGDTLQLLWDELRDESGLQQLSVTGKRQFVSPIADWASERQLPNSLSEDNTAGLCKLFISAGIHQPIGSMLRAWRKMLAAKRDQMGAVDPLRVMQLMDACRLATQGSLSDHSFELDRT